MTNRRYHPVTDDDRLTYLIVESRRTDDEAADIMGFDRDTITTHRERLGLARNRRPKVYYIKPEVAPAPPKEIQNPLAVAKIWLGRRLVEKPSGYWLDGLPAKLDTIMQASNRLIKAAGAEQITHSERWRV